MKSMMGIKRSSAPSARTLKRASSVIKKAGSAIISLPKVVKRNISTTGIRPMLGAAKKFGEGKFGPKLRLDETVMNPSLKAPAAVGNTPRAVAPVAPVAPTKKLSSKALRRAAAATPAAKPTTK